MFALPKTHQLANHSMCKTPGLMRGGGQSLHCIGSLNYRLITAVEALYCMTLTPTTFRLTYMAHTTTSLEGGVGAQIFLDHVGPMHLINKLLIIF